MEEITQKKTETTLMDIVRLLLSKIKLLILIMLIGAALGAGFGILRTHNVEYYGTEVKFYINPSRNESNSVNSDSQYGVYGAYGKNVMNNMVELLSSEAFAERLLLDDNGLPEKERIDLIDKAELTTAWEKANQSAQAYNNKKTDLDAALIALNEATENLNAKWDELRRKTENSDWPVKPVKGENTEIDALFNIQDAAQATYTETYEQTKMLLDIAEEDKESVLESWREEDKEYYTSKLNAIVSCVRYSYYDETSNVNVDDLARSFIYVDISVLNDVEHAKNLRENIIKHVPKYIEEKMPVPTGYDGTNCIRISRTDEVHQTNSGVVAKTAVKYGLLLAAAAVVVAAIVIIIIDRSDKRLRSIEQITDIFNIPVLGVIPTFKNSQHAEEMKNTEVKK